MRATETLKVQRKALDMNVATYTLNNGQTIKVLIVGEDHRGVSIKFFVRGFVPMSAQALIVDSSRLSDIRPA